MSERLDQTDRELLALLSADARRPVAGLASALGLARSTVLQRVRRLERNGVIAGYTIRLGAAVAPDVRAHVSLVVDGRRAEAVLSALHAIDEVRTLHSTSGAFDLVALVVCTAPGALDAVIDRMSAIPGVERTTTALLLATKFERDALPRPAR